MTQRRFVSWLVLLAALGLASCASEARVCVPGDQYTCRCGDESWGYRTCDNTGMNYSHCDCIFGLSPDASLVSPYMSGRGTGGGSQDAGAQDSGTR